MLENTPTQSTMTELLGQPLFAVWQELCSAIDEKYDMERLWNTGGKNWVYEYKYRRGGKTLCSLYAKKNSLGFMIIFGKDESLRWASTSSAAIPSPMRESAAQRSGSASNLTARNSWKTSSKRFQEISSCTPYGRFPTVLLSAMSMTS